MALKLVFDKITPDLKKKAKKLEQIAPEATKHFKSVTPKRTGNARNKTKLQGGNTINADYNYATRLEQGASSQAPRNSWHNQTVPGPKANFNYH